MKSAFVTAHTGISQTLFQYATSLRNLAATVCECVTERERGRKTSVELCFYIPVFLFIAAATDQ